MNKMKRLVFGVALCALLLPGLSQAQTRVTVGSLTVDGLEVRNLSCFLAQGGLLASAAVVSALAKQKKPLDACQPAGAAFEVKWEWDKATTVEVTRSTAKTRDKCVLGVMKKTRGPRGTCSAVLLVGKAEAAGKAADTLKPAPEPAPEKKK